MCLGRLKHLSETKTHDVRSSPCTLLDNCAFLRLDDVESQLEIMIVDSTHAWFRRSSELEEVRT